MCQLRIRLRVVALLLVVTVRKGWFVLFRVGLLDRFYCNNLLYNLSRNGDGKKTAERGWRIVQLTLLSSAFLFAAAGIRAKDAGFL